ncbi:hypothetical protein A2U01_0049692, partial [Trifolium medium]|nr:hypothetical protein [Trifolium medium]
VLTARQAEKRPQSTQEIPVDRAQPPAQRRFADHSPLLINR